MSRVVTVIEEVSGDFDVHGLSVEIDDKYLHWILEFASQQQTIQIERLTELDVADCCKLYGFFQA